MPLTAVAFDLDETLAVPQRDRETILNEAVQATGAPPITRQAYLDAHSANLTEETREPIFAALLEGRETATSASDLAAAYRERITSSLRPVPGVETLVTDLRRRYRVGLLTNGPVLAQHEKIRTLGWTEAFDTTLVTGSLAAGKPDPRAFEALLDELGVDASEAAYVGDDVNADVAGASAVGMPTIQVLFEDGPAPDPRATVHLPRDELTARLPDVLASL